MQFYRDETYLNWVERLSNDDFVVIDDFISEDSYAEIRNFFLRILNKDKFDKAGIGAMSEFQVDKSVRGDFIYWLDKERDNEISDVFHRIEELIEKLNYYCFLSISDYELHLAHYPVGTFYKRHLDQFRDRNNRVISFVLYLNEGWNYGDGGELKIFRPDSSVLVEPLAKRLLLFRSDRVEHEVCITNVNRYSLTGWFLHQPVGLGFL
jgi:SM-20-related protein